MEEQRQVSEKQDSIKVSKSTTGKYSWDIKLYYDSSKVLGKDVIGHLKELDRQLQLEFDTQ